MSASTDLTTIIARVRELDAAATRWRMCRVTAWSDGAGFPITVEMPGRRAAEAGLRAALEALPAEG